MSFLTEHSSECRHVMHDVIGACDNCQARDFLSLRIGEDNMRKLGGILDNGPTEETRNLHVTLAEFSVHTAQALSHAGIQTLGELSEWNAYSLLRLHGFGRTQLKEVREILQAHRMRLRLRPESPPRD